MLGPVSIYALGVASGILAKFIVDRAVDPGQPVSSPQQRGELYECQADACGYRGGLSGVVNHVIDEHGAVDETMANDLVQPADNAGVREA